MSGDVPLTNAEALTDASKDKIVADKQDSMTGSSNQFGFSEAPSTTSFGSSSNSNGLTRDDISKVFKNHWKVGYGSVSIDECIFIQNLIATHRPQSFLEIGMASGLSGGLIATMLDRFGGKRFTSLDHDNTFFGDPTKQNGFLMEAVYPDNAVELVKRPFTTAVNLDDLDENFDMAFIDANHQHPWPLIDTLCLFPHLTGSKIVIHHDLRLFRKQDVVYGIGPKYLYDQFPSNRKSFSTLDDGNIFLVDLNITKSELEDIAADGFSLPWSLRTPLQREYLDKITAMIARHYSVELQKEFARTVKKFNVMDRFRSGL